MTSRMRGVVAGVVIGACVLGVSALACAPGTQLWIKQFGTSQEDALWNAPTMAVDAAGNLVVAGFTGGNLGGVNQGGKHDVFFAKFGPGGSRRWVRLLGTPEDENANAVAIDPEGNIILGIGTFGSLFGPSHGDQDAVIAKYSPDGSQLLWGLQLGTEGDDGTIGVATDADGNVIAAGWAEGYLYAWIAKYDRNGSLLWSRQFGTGYTFAYDVKTDAFGRILVSGHTAGDLFGTSHGDHDCFIVVFDRDGNQLWARQFGTSGADWCSGSGFDSAGNVFVTGGTFGSLGGPNQGDRDCLLVKYSADGKKRMWARQVGTPTYDACASVAVDAHGNAIMGGYTRAALVGEYKGETDAFVIKYSANGRRLWAHQLGTAAADDISPFTTDGKGNVYVGGTTTGSLGGPNKGERDVFIAKFAP